jgi:hypothetical protein
VRSTLPLPQKRSRKTLNSSIRCFIDASLKSAGIKKLKNV